MCPVVQIQPLICEGLIRFTAEYAQSEATRVWSNLLLRYFRFPVNVSLTCPDGWATVGIHLPLPWFHLLLEDLHLKKMLWHLKPQTVRFSIFVLNCRDCPQLSLQCSVFYVWRNEYILPLYTLPFWECFSGLVASFWSVFPWLPSLPLAFTGGKRITKSPSLHLIFFCESLSGLKTVLLHISVSKKKVSKLYLNKN